MYIEIDFESSEAIYEQLCNQIILGIAKNVIREGESLPSVRAMAEQVGVNMHTVNLDRQRCKISINCGSALQTGLSK